MSEPRPTSPTAVSATGTEAADGPASVASGPPSVASASPTPRITSDRLFNGAPELQIDHHGAIYRLKLTALGKLILTK